ncbi:MAG: response regulator [Lentisphaerae bacterium]|nr:response regulator [Lentisphaerota bacterium]
MSMAADSPALDILLVEDNAGDVQLIREMIKERCLSLNLLHVRDGLEALAFLRKEAPYGQAPGPRLIFLDLNLPRKDGWELLDHLKSHPDWRRIPVVVLTTSRSEHDIRRAYDAHANCVINKPLDYERFLSVWGVVSSFWFETVMLPPL